MRSLLSARPVFLGLTIFAVTAAYAHEGVKDPQVKARMDAMSEISKHFRVLAEMDRGRRDFDRREAQEAANALAAVAATVPGLFEPRATDPKSEARPEIWENFSDFTQKSQALQDAAAKTAGIRSESNLGRAVREINGTCRACHSAYRL